MFDGFLGRAYACQLLIGAGYFEPTSPHGLPSGMIAPIVDLWR
jgi:hypothetical protein